MVTTVVIQEQSSYNVDYLVVGGGGGNGVGNTGAGSASPLNVNGSSSYRESKEILLLTLLQDQTLFNNHITQQVL